MQNTAPQTVVTLDRTAELEHLGDEIALLAALIIGFSFLPGLSGAILVAAGIIGLVLFVRWEMRSPSSRLI